MYSNECSALTYRNYDFPCVTSFKPRLVIHICSRPEWRMWKWKKGKRLANDFESRVESLQDLLLQKLLKKRKKENGYNVCKWFPWGWEGQRCEDISSVNVWRKMDRKKGDFLLGFFFLKNSFFHHFLSVFVFLFFNFQIRRHGGDVIDNPSIRNLEEKSKNAD